MPQNDPVRHTPVREMNGIAEHELMVESYGVDSLLPTVDRSEDTMNDYNEFDAKQQEEPGSYCEWNVFVFKVEVSLIHSLVCAAPS